jgi:predicted MFS family arabinose efflux permease
MATVAGMALGGWMSGAIFDLTGSYRAAFLNGIAWNLLNMAIAFWLLPAASARGRHRRDRGGRPSRGDRAWRSRGVGRPRLLPACGLELGKNVPFPPL